MYYFAVSELSAFNARKPFTCMPDAIDWIIDIAISHGMTFIPEIGDETTLWFRDHFGWLQWAKVVEIKL